MRALHKEEMAVVAGGLGDITFTNTQSNSTQTNFQGGNTGIGCSSIGVDNNFPNQVAIQNGNVIGPVFSESINNTSLSI